VPKKFAEEMHKEFPDLPLWYNYSANFKWSDSPLTFDDIAAMGYKVITYSSGCIRVSKQAVTNFAADVMKRKEQAIKDFRKEKQKV